ncbi:MAG: response regulator [Desulfobacterales bacterium]|nr:response regulator [Desulfobacterales bacterium]
MRALIVEDNPVSSSYLKKILPDCFECDIADTGEKAIDSFIKYCKMGKSYDLILLDMILPNMGGDEVIKKLREKEIEIFGENRSKILIQTALDDIDALSDKFENYCDGYINKPYDRYDVIGKLREVGFEVDY